MAQTPSTETTASDGQRGEKGRGVKQRSSDKWATADLWDPVKAARVSYKRAAAVEAARSDVKVALTYSGNRAELNSPENVQSVSPPPPQVSPATRFSTIFQNQQFLISESERDFRPSNLKSLSSLFLPKFKILQPSRCGRLWVLLPKADDMYTAVPTTNPGIKEKISNVLQYLQFPSYLTDVLVQFWAPVTSSDRCFLSTSDQPFGISKYNEGLCEFKNLSEQYRFYVDPESQEELSCISHVFIQKSGLFIQDVQDPFTEKVHKGYPQLDHISRSDVCKFVALPVIEPTNLSCMGVIELVLIRDVMVPADYMHLILEVCKQLKADDLKSSFDLDQFLSLDVSSSLELRRKLSPEEVVRSFVDKSIINSFQICQTTESPPRTEGLHNERGMIQTDPLFQQLPLEDDDGINNGNGVITVEDETNIVDTDLQNEDKTNISEREHSNTGGSVTCEVLKRYFGMSLQDATMKLGVSRSKLKRICRQHGIARWPSHRRNKDNQPSSLKLHPSEAMTPKAHTQMPNTKLQDERTVTIKATYGEDMIKFQLSVSSLMEDLENEVAKRLNMKRRTFRLKYVDEDNDWILMVCDADLKTCICMSESLGTTTIKMLVQPISLP